MYAGERFNKKIVWELAKANAPQCLIWLMGKCKNFFNIFPVKEMLFFASSNMREEMGIPIIKYLADRFPEKVATCVDELGNNLLWYLLHNRYVAWWRSNCGMARALVKAGCNPDSLNHLDLSFNKIVHNVSKEQRKKLEEQLKENLS